MKRLFLGMYNLHVFLNTFKCFYFCLFIRTILDCDAKVKSEKIRIEDSYKKNFIKM